LIDGAAAVFADGANREAKVSERYARIGRPTVERDFYHGGPGDEPGRAGADDRMLANICRDTTTSAVWKVT
jgi:hypothetical protein